jgi:hypothetical protein
MFTQITNHVQQGLARLMNQYKNAVYLQGILTAIINPIQDIENALTDMNNLRYLPNATGAQLDVIGLIVGIARVAGQSDASYLMAIYAQIQINVSEGTPEQVIVAFNIFTGSTFSLLFEFSASIIIESEWVPADQAAVDTLITNISQATPAGVRVDGIVSFDPTEAFAYDGVLPGLGYDDGSQTVGGKYPTLYQYIGGGFAYAGVDPTGLGYGSLQDPLVGGAYLT